MNIVLRYEKEFIAHLKNEKRYSSHTIRAYKTDLNQLILFAAIESMVITAKNFKAIVELYLQKLFSDNFQKSTIARRIFCYRTFVLYLKRFHEIYIKLNIRIPKIANKLPVYLTDAEITLLILLHPKNIKSPFPYRDCAIFELLFSTGVRCSELVNIKINDIDFEQRTIRILGKGNKERIVLFGKFSQQKIEAYCQQERNNANSPYLFLNHYSDPLTTRSIQRIINSFSQYLPVQKRISPHALRHSFATHLINKDMDIRSLQVLLGHASLSNTQRYLHLGITSLKKIANTTNPYNELKKKN